MCYTNKTKIFFWEILLIKIKFTESVLVHQMLIRSSGEGKWKYTQSTQVNWKAIRPMKWVIKQTEILRGQYRTVTITWFYMIKKINYPRYRTYRPTYLEKKTQMEQQTAGKRLIQCYIAFQILYPLHAIHSHREFIRSIAHWGYFVPKVAWFSSNES